VKYENGTIARGAASLGQSLAVLQKRTAIPPAGPDLTSSAATDSAASNTAAALPAATLRNVSARARVPAGESATVGVIVGGTAPCRALVRAVGSTLRLFGVPAPLQHLHLTVQSGEVVVATATAPWRGAAEIAAAAREVGAFPLAADSSDAALILTLMPGSHTVVVKGESPSDTGDVLIEVYLL
jgi:hypothetical protein